MTPHVPIALTCLLAITGCVPMRYEMLPRITGSVTGRHGGEAIENASVRAGTGGRGIYTTSATASTSDSGHFVIPAQHRWGIFMAGQSIVVQQGELWVSAPGYLAERREIGPVIPERGATLHFDIQMKKKLSPGSRANLERQASSGS
jgi:hypothetical protein